MLARLRPASPARRVLIGLGAVLLALGIWGFVDLLRIQHDIAAGEHALKAVRAKDLAKRDALVRVTAPAQARFVQADRIARRGLPFRLARPIPLIGVQVGVIRSLTRAAATVGRIGNDAAHNVQPKLDVATEGPPARMKLLNAANAELFRARVRLQGVRVHRNSWAMPPLRGAQAHLANSLVNARARLRDMQLMVGGLRQTFAGPSRYLILAGNNAEMRAGAMPLSAGVAKITSGAISIVGDGFLPTALLFRDPPVIVPPNLGQLYGWMAIGAEWRATTATPNFPASARMYAQMIIRVGGGPVAGVIFIDVLALKGVIAATGPVEIDGKTYTKDNIEQQVMNENYLRYGDPNDQSARYDLQSKIGTAVLDALNSRPVRLGVLISNLTAAGKGRHLLAWSVDPAVQRVWQRAGIDGHLLPDNGLMVNMQNITANKLDWYITPRVALRTLSTTRRNRRVELSVSFTNTPRTRTSDVVEGLVYDRQYHLTEGEHRVYLVIYLPRSASDVGADDPPFTTIGVDGGMKVVGFQYGVPKGKSRTVTITFTVPKDLHFRIIPSARAHPVSYFTPKGHVTDDKPAVIGL